MIPFPGFGGSAGSQHHGACVWCIDMGTYIWSKTVYFFLFSLSSTSALLLLISLFIPFITPHLFLPPAAVRQSDYSGSGSAGVFEPSGSLVWLWSVHSRGRDWWDQVTERDGDKEEDSESETEVGKPWTIKTNSLKGCWFIWLVLSYGRNLQQNGWCVTFKCLYRAAVGSCSVGSEIKCGNSWSGLLPLLVTLCMDSLHIGDC